MLTSPYPFEPAGTTRNPLIVTTLFGVLACLTAVLRIMSRKLNRLPLGIDDLFIAFALFWTLVMLGLQWACVVRGGTGHHLADINPFDAVKTLKMIIPFEAIYALANCSVKLSILCFYIRIFGTDRNIRKLVIIFGVIVILWALHIVLETFLICRPLAMNWDATVKGHCGNRNVMFVFAGASNMVTDLMVLLLPVRTIWHLKMPMLRRLGVISIFCLGTFITIISIIRLKSLLDIDFTDPTYTLPMGLMWSVLEPELSILSANLPMIRPLFKHFFPRIFTSGVSRSRMTGSTDPQKMFQRLDDGTYPLNSMDPQSVGRGNLQKGAYTVDVSHTRSTSKGIFSSSDATHQRNMPYGGKNGNTDNRSVSSGEVDYDHSGHRQNGLSINVQKEWNISHK